MYLGIKKGASGFRKGDSFGIENGGRGVQLAENSLRRQRRSFKSRAMARIERRISWLDNYFKSAKNTAYDTDARPPKGCREAIHTGKSPR